MERIERKNYLLKVCSVIAAGWEHVPVYERGPSKLLTKA